ncbi:g7716 [Coccomyxa elongata]
MGCSGAVLMYGATGSGKTWTMTGGAGDLGLVQQSVMDLFAALAVGAAPHQTPAVSMSILEIYNEKLLDLLSPKQAQLDVRQGTSSSNCHVAGLTQVALTSAHDAMSALSRGLAHRKVRGTAMNDNSSRSHTIVTITVRTRIATGDAPPPLQQEQALEHEAVLHLVDLAVQVTNDGEGRRESASINKSLLALGRVISALSEGNASHVNFRDSKLTRLLQPTLAGDASKVAIICTATPAASQAHETRNTLEFGMRARRVKLPRQAVKPSTDKELIRHLQREICELRAQLASQNRQPCIAGSFCEAAESQLSAESADDMPGELAAQIMLCAQGFDSADSQLSAVSAAMSAVGVQMPLSIETASFADPADESSGLPTPPQETEGGPRARLRSRLDYMSPEAIAAEDRPCDIARKGFQSIDDWQVKPPPGRTLEHMSAHARAMQRGKVEGGQYVEGWHGDSGLVGELDSQLPDAGLFNLQKCSCSDAQGFSGVCSQIRCLQHASLNHMADDDLLKLIDGLIEV